MNDSSGAGHRPLPSRADAPAVGQDATTPGRSDVLVPEGTTLLHIGVPKTGTTRLQDSLAAMRDQLTDAGVTYPGRLLEHSRAALSVLGQSWGWQDQGGWPVNDRWWPELLAATEAAETPRVLISSEYFCEANDAQVRQIVDGLGRGKLHVLLTLRPLGRLLPTSWQQYLKSGTLLPYESWLAAVLAEPPDPEVTPSFWRRHDHGDVIRRWVAAVGPDRVSVVVVDARNHSFLPRTFEALLGLPEGLLDPRPEARSNRSLTAPEAELIRRFNDEVRPIGVAWSDYERLLRKGAVLRLVEHRTPPPHEDRISTPRWALDRAAELGARTAETIRQSGVRVLGDLSALARDHGAPADATAPQSCPDVPVDAAVTALIGTTLASTRAPVRPPSTVEPLLTKRRVEQVTARELVGVLRARAWKALRRLLTRSTA